MLAIMSNQTVRAMSKRDFVYAYDSEPALDRTTGFGRTDHSALLSTTSAAWSASEHSTFEQPSRSLEIVQARRTRQENRYVITMVLVAVTAVSAAVVAALH